MNSQADDAPTAIAAAVIVMNARVLMVRRRVAEGPLSWQFPAGKIEPGETDEAAAVRETNEEVGVTVEAVKSLGERLHPVTGRRMVYIACQVLDGTPHVAAEREITEVEWCDRVKLAENVPYPLHGPVRDYLDESLA